MICWEASDQHGNAKRRPQGAAFCASLKPFRQRFQRITTFEVTVDRALTCALVPRAVLSNLPNKRLKRTILSWMTARRWRGFIASLCRHQRVAECGDCSQEKGHTRGKAPIATYPSWQLCCRILAYRREAALFTECQTPAAC